MGAQESKSKMERLHEDAHNMMSDEDHWKAGLKGCRQEALFFRACLLAASEGTGPAKTTPSLEPPAIKAAAPLPDTTTGAGGSATTTANPPPSSSGTQESNQSPHPPSPAPPASLDAKAMCERRRVVMLLCRAQHIAPRTLIAIDKCVTANASPADPLALKAAPCRSLYVALEETHAEYQKRFGYYGGDEYGSALVVKKGVGATSKQQSDQGEVPLDSTTAASSSQQQAPSGSASSSSSSSSSSTTSSPPPVTPSSSSSPSPSPSPSPSLSPSPSPPSSSSSS